MGRRPPASRKVPVLVCLTMVALVVGAVTAIWLVDRSGPRSGPVVSDSAAGISVRLTLVGPDQISAGRPIRALVTNLGPAVIGLEPGVGLQRSTGFGWSEIGPALSFGTPLPANLALLRPGTTAQVGAPGVSARGDYRIVVPLWSAHKLTLAPTVEGALTFRVSS